MLKSGLKLYVYGYCSDYHDLVTVQLAKKNINESQLFGIINEDSLVQISTCNREELYFIAPEGIVNELSLGSGFLLEGYQAFEKLVLTITGLKTPILGDVHIYQQVKECIGKKKRLNDLLRQELDKAFALARFINREFDVKGKRESFAAIFFQEILESISGYETVAIVGSGTMAMEFVFYCIHHSMSFVDIYSRSYIEGQASFKKHGIRNFLTSDFRPSNYNIIILALSVDQPIFKAHQFESVKTPTHLLDLGECPAVENFNHSNLVRYNLSHFSERKTSKEPMRQKMISEVKPIIMHTYRENAFNLP